MFGNKSIVPTDIGNRFLDASPTIEEIETALKPFGNSLSCEWYQDMVDLALPKITTMQDGRKVWTLSDTDKMRKLEKETRGRNRKQQRRKIIQKLGFRARHYCVLVLKYGDR